MKPFRPAAAEPQDGIVFGDNRYTVCLKCQRAYKIDHRAHLCGAEFGDVVNAPDHYRQGKVEVIEVTETLDFCRGNVVKYVLRSEHKGAEIEDLKKARWYLDRLITRLEREIGGDA